MSPAPAPAPQSTVEQLLHDQRDLRAELHALRRRRWARRAVLTVFALIVVAALFGVFGQRARTVQAASGDTTLSVRYPAVGRDGPPASVEITVRRPGGFSEPVEVTFDARYLDVLDPGVLTPQPESERSAGDDVVWSFTPPTGDELVVRFDGELSSHAPARSHGHVAVRATDGSVVAVGFSTWVWP
jgi:hypothetical protein